MAKKSKNRVVTYFEQKDNIRPIALGALIVGLLLMWLGWSFISYILAAILIPVGLVAYIVSAARIVSHEEVPDQAKRAMRDYDSEFLNSKEFSKEVLKHPVPVEVELHLFGEGVKYYKKLKDGRVISDVYSKSHFFFTNDRLLIISRRASLCELDDLTRAGIEDKRKDILFSQIKCAVIEEFELEVTLSDTKKTINVKQYELVINGEENIITSIPVRNDISVETLCKDINRRCTEK